MKKKYKVLLLSSVLLLSLLLTPTLLAEGRRHGQQKNHGKKYKKNINCDIYIVLTMGVGWDGQISGDIDGEFFIQPLGQYFDYEPFEVYWEEWQIETDEGTITVLQSGVWSFDTFKFLSNGPVVDATGEWEYLIGSTMYVSGVTTEVPPPPDEQVTGTGKMWISLEKPCEDYDD